MPMVAVMENLVAEIHANVQVRKERGHQQERLRVVMLQGKRYRGTQGLLSALGLKTMAELCEQKGIPLALFHSRRRQRAGDRSI